VVKSRVGGSGTVLEKKAFKSSVVGITHGGGDANIGGDTSEDKVLDVSVVEDDAEVSSVERSLARLIDDGLVVVWLEFGNDVPSRLSTDENTTASNVGVSDSGVHSCGSPALVGWQIRKISAVTFSGVNDDVAFCFGAKSTTVRMKKRKVRTPSL